jgi:hypothetical protein
MARGARHARSLARAVVRRGRRRLGVIRHLVYRGVALGRQGMGGIRGIV